MHFQSYRNSKKSTKHCCSVSFPKLRIGPIVWFIMMRTMIPIQVCVYSLKRSLVGNLPKEKSGDNIIVMENNIRNP